MLHDIKTRTNRFVLLSTVTLVLFSASCGSGQLSESATPIEAEEEKPPGEPAASPENGEEPGV